MNMVTSHLQQTRGCFNYLLDKIRVISVRNGALKAEYQVTEDCVNEYQMVSNGFSATVVDVLTSLGLQSSFGKPVDFVSVEMHFNFLQPARLGDDVVIQTKVLKKGKSLCFLEAELRNKTTDDLLVKAGQVVYMLNQR